MIRRLPRGTKKRSARESSHPMATRPRRTRRPGWVLWLRPANELKDFLRVPQHWDVEGAVITNPQQVKQIFFGIVAIVRISDFIEHLGVDVVRDAP